MSCCPTELGAMFNGQRAAEWDFIGGNAVAPIADGMLAPTVVGTPTSRVLTTLTPASNAKRIGYVSAAAINSLASLRSTAFVVGNGATTPGAGRYLGGGWRLLMQWSVGDVVLNGEARMFLGMTVNTGAPAAVDPLSVANVIGFGCDTNETTLRVLATDGALNVTEIDLGASFPSGSTLANTNDTLYRGMIFCPPGQSTAADARFEWAIERVQTGVVMSGVIAAAGNAPGGGQVMTPVCWRSTGPANAAAVGLEMYLVRIQTEL